MLKTLNSFFVFVFCLEIKKVVLPENQTIGKNGWKQKNMINYILIFSNFFKLYNKELIIKAKILLIKSNKNHHHHHQCFMIVFVISFILLFVQTLFLIIFITEVLNHEGVPLRVSGGSILILLFFIYRVMFIELQCPGILLKVLFIGVYFSLFI